MPEITGATRLVGIVADPIAHVRTPQSLNRLFAVRGIDAVMVPMHVPSAYLASWFAGLRRIGNLDGIVATVPHKEAIAALCDDLGPEARLVGAANVVRRAPDGRMIGEMFDGRGFVGGLRSQGIDPAGHRVLLIGAGGAAAAIAFALAAAGVAHLTIANRTAVKAEKLANRVATAFPGVAVDAGDPDPRGCSLVVNGTSLGLKPDDPLPVRVERLEGAAIVAEVVMQPARTALLEAAAGMGCRMHEGFHMLEAQLALLAEFLTASDLPVPTTAQPNL
ncbi:MAG TPA: shikimate dehydrogenase [Azospirillaceae bacterium]|nr:shikimate dehydrogenase [Azospirillaceae bacterium]